MSESVDGINIASQHYVGGEVHRSVPFSVRNNRDQFYTSCYPLATFIPSIDSAHDVCTSQCNLTRICSDSFVPFT